MAQGRRALAQTAPLGRRADLAVLLLMVTLFRMAKRGSAAAGVLLGVAVLLTLAPGGLFLVPPPLNTAYVFGQTVLWILTLILLHGGAPPERSGVLRRPPDSSPPASAAPALPP